MRLCSHGTLDPVRHKNVNRVTSAKGAKVVGFYFGTEYSTTVLPVPSLGRWVVESTLAQVRVEAGYTENPVRQ